MALKTGNRIYTGSAAVVPVIEGQQIRKNSGNALSNCLLKLSRGWQSLVLHEKSRLVEGPRIDLRNRTFKATGYPTKGITDTGVIAVTPASVEMGK